MSLSMFTKRPSHSDGRHKRMFNQYEATICEGRASSSSRKSDFRHTPPSPYSKLSDPVPPTICRVFRGKFVTGLRQALQRKQLVLLVQCQSLANEKAFAAPLRRLYRQDWVVYAKPPFGGPEHVLL